MKSLIISLPEVVNWLISSGFTASAPTGQVNNSTSGFVVSQGGKSGAAAFIFATEDGTISGWSPAVNAGESVLGVDNSNGGNGAVYKGLAIATNSGATFLYATNFRAGTVEMYNSSFGLVKSFAYPNPPPVPIGTPTGQNWAPFNVQLLSTGSYTSPTRCKTPPSTMMSPGRATALSTSSI